MKSASVVISAAALVLLAGCSKHSTGETTAAPALPPAKVRLATVHVDNVAPLIEVTGIVRPVQRAQVAAKVMGAIEELPVALGQRVRTGDLLLKISAGEITARVAQAQAQLNVARRDLERERDLLTKGASTADMVRGLEDRLSMTQAMVREAEVMLGYTIIRAPFDGVVARKLANAGDLAAPGMPLLEIEGTTDFQVEAAIPDSLAAKLSPGVSLPIAIPTSGASFNGTLAELSSAADASAHTVLAKVAVPAAAAVRSGEFARVQLPGPPERALLAPATAVSVLGQMERVFVAGEDNRAVLRLVKTGAARLFASQQSVEILSGLDDGERIVAAPPAGLREGQPLEVVP
jgi:RND family efflux transporter MFP subunit